MDKQHRPDPATACNAPFTFREYCEETDFALFRDYWYDQIRKTTAYLVRGASPYPTEEELRRQLRQQCRRCHYPFVIADADNKAIGCSAVLNFIRIANRHDFHIVLWEHPELMEEVLRQTLAAIFSSPLVEAALCEAPGYDPVFLAACQALGMEQVGCIPDYEVYEGKTFPLYIFLMKKDPWNTRFQSQP